MSYNGRIPVPGCVTSVRKSTRDQRLKIVEKRKEEQVKEEEQRRREQEAARILASRWAEEDRLKKHGRAEGESSSSKRGALDRPRRGREDDESGEDAGFTERRSRRFREGGRPPRREDEREAPDRPRSRSRDRGEARETAEAADGRSRRKTSSRVEEAADEQPARRQPEREQERHIPNFTLSGLVSADAAAVRQQEPVEDEQPGGWAVVEDSRRIKRDEVRVETAQKRKAEPSRLKGVFGLDDSDEEDRAGSEKLMARKKSSLAPLPRPKGDMPAQQGTGSIAVPRPAVGASSVAEVQMKVAQWKLSLKGKAAKMPEDLQREVAAVMGTPMM